MFEGFEQKRMPGEGAEINLRHGGRVGGDAPAVLMIHGYPQTHIIWRHLAPRLAETHHVVCPDLRGYGDSSCPPTDADHMPYSKRAMARDLVKVMADLGHEEFAIVSHDRGARVGHRLAMDFPDKVSKLCSLDVVPTGSVWQRANKNWAMGSFHWLFLAQPYPRPETLIGHDPDFWLTWLMESWSADMAAFADGALDDYKHAHRNPAVIHANCEDYRAGATIDDKLDRADLDAGSKMQCPVLALWGGVRKQGGPKTDGATSALDIWGEWADDVQGGPLPCGHFLAEEAPDAVWAELAPFLGIAR
ncbi:MAG: alpha/beta hydrolase [Rhodospirillales bacterium]